MQIVSSWRGSLGLLVPAHLTLLLLVSIKGAVQTYYLVLRYWWWLLLLLAIGDRYLAPQLAPQFITSATPIHYIHIGWLYGYGILRLLLWFIILLSARSSIKNKNSAYFLSYSCRFFLVMLLGEFVIGAAISLPLAWVISVLHWNPWIVYEAGMRYFIGYLLLIWDFFLLDTGRPFCLGKSLRNMLRMFWHNLPFIAVSFVLFDLLQLGIAYLMYYGTSSFSLPIRILIKDGCWFLLLVLVINIVATFYLKRVHDQWEIYCQQ